MKSKYPLVIFIAFLLPIFCNATETNPPKGIYLDGDDSKIAVILCPGRGEKAENMVTHPLREAIHEELGYHTLMLELPQSLEMYWREHIHNFPEAYRRIQAAIDYYKKVKNVEKVYLMGHSMGSRMATGFIAEFPDAGVAGFIGVGIRSGGRQPLDSNKNLKEINIPVVDIFGDGGDGKDAKHALPRKRMVSDRYTQVLISGANHKFTQHRKEMTNAVVSWLRKQNEETID